MKPPSPLPTISIQRLLLLPGLLAVFLMTGCSSERRDRLWETLDPAGYKHAHSESFNGARALPTRNPDANPKNDGMALELEQ